jgi:hypothetical protein
MSKALQFSENGLEEFIDEGLDECILEWFNEYLNEMSSQDGNCLELASLAAVTSVGRGISMYLSFKITDYLVSSITKKAGLYWAYINIGKLKDILKRHRPTKGFVGKAGSFLFKNILASDTTSDRIEILKLAQTEIARFDTHTFEHNKIFNGHSNSLEKKKDSVMAVRDKKKVQNTELFRYKTMTSSWTNSTYDKRCFEAVTGQKASHTGKGSWATRYKELNNLSTFAKDMEGNLISHAQLMLKNMNLANTSRL